MRLHPLGHAMHLVEVSGLRLLFDPLLTDRHHGGVFEVAPPRRLDVESLRPDFLFVSHRHPDHFDVPSLRRLALLDPDTVVVTPDALVARTAERVGFRTVRLIGPDTRVDLDGVRFVTTPSRANDAPLAPEALEWGVALAGEHACLWNQVDSVLRSSAEVAAARERLESALGARLDLALVRWCPLLEVEAALGRAFGFPYAAYADLLEQAAALAEAGVTVSPASAGARHAPPWSAMNSLVYPVDEARFLRDLRARVPRAHALPSSVGRVIDVRTRADIGASPHVEALAFDDDRVFRPHALPPMVDAYPAPDPAAIEAFVRGPLAEACRELGCCVLEVVFADRVVHFTLRDGTVTHQDDPDWDHRNVVVASWLDEVLAGRRHFGDLLLAGALRAATRDYSIGPGGLKRGREPVFLYRGLSYEESVARAVEWEVRRCLG